jgi:hypothetical protein
MRRSAIMANNINNPTTGGSTGNTGRTGTTGGSTGTGTMANMQNAAGNLADKTRDATRSTVESVRDTATGVMDRAKDVAGNVADTARDWASGAVNAVKDSDVVNKAEQYVSNAWETGSRYIHEHNLSDMAEDVAGVIRRNPIPAMLVGIGLGFILARSLRS